VAGLIVVCGLRREAAILSGDDRTAICGNASTLQERLSGLAGSKPRLVLSWGLCGGLDPRLRPGDLVVGSGAVSVRERVPADEGVASLLTRRLAEAGARVSLERFAGTPAPVLTAGDKAALRRATGAAAVDMESLIAGRFAREQEAPFAILRAVADPAERDMPPLAAEAIDARGRLRSRAVFASLLRSPPQLLQLAPLVRDSRAAFSALQRCRRLLPGLFVGLGLADL